MSALCIEIKTDGEDRVAATELKLDNWRDAEPAEIRQRVRDAGIVGLGGAGFPTAVKLNPGANREVELLLINAAECEPYISCDEALIRSRAEDIVLGIEIIAHALQAKQIVIGIEDNMPEAIEAIKAVLAQHDGNDIQVIPVPTLYPAGGEKQLIYALTGEEVPSQGLPIDIGIICHNVGTAAAISAALIHGKPLISRVVTVTGAGVEQPANIDVRIGTPISHLISECGGYTEDISRLILGGPMMGYALRSDELPITKTSNCVLATTVTKTAQEAACIRCGLCVDVCPAQLLPQQLYWHARARDFDRIQDYKLFDCIECGCCTQVCPSRIPLVDYYRFAKNEIWEQERNREISDASRQRHEFRLDRIVREKKELEERRAKARKNLSRNSKGNAGNKKTEIEAALERVKTKKAEQSVFAKNTDNLTGEQREKILEIDRRRAKAAQTTERPQ